MGVEPWQRHNAHDDAIIKINLCDMRTWQSSLFRVLEQEHILLCPHSMIFNHDTLEMHLSAPSP